MMKNQKGITLIALVITIIVLLILAGVSIAMLTGDNGVLTKAKEANVANLRASADDYVNLAIQSLNIEIQKQKIDDSDYNPVGNEAALEALTGNNNFPETTDWTLPSAIAASTEIVYKNAEYKDANDGKSRVYTITVSSSGAKLESTTDEVK